MISIPEPKKATVLSVINNFNPIPKKDAPNNSRIKQDP